VCVGGKGGRIQCIKSTNYEDLTAT